MPVKTKAQLQAEAAQIANETGKRLNTAPRVGNALLDIIDTMGNVVDVTSYGAATTNTGAANDVAIAAAIAAALAANASLLWPAGVFISAASLANFHSVRHWGPGVVQRGADLFVVDPKWGDVNTLYVSTAGTGDGLSSSQPMALGSYFTALANYGYLDGTWRMQGAAGTYSFAGATVSGMRSRNALEFYGPDVAYGTPTMIVDGTIGGTDACGFYFRNYVQAYVKDIKFQNYDKLGNGCGVAADEHSSLTTINVHTTLCANGTDVETGSRLYVTGGTHAGNQLYNIRAYAQCTVTIGYNSSSHRVQIGAVVNGGGAGILVRDNSSGHIDYTDIDGVTGSGGGVQVQNQSRVHFVSCVFGGVTPNYYNVRLDNGSTFIDTSSTFNAASARSVVEFGFSLDNDGNTSVYYDRATTFFRFGLSTTVLPSAKWHFQASSPGTGVSYNGNVKMALEDTSPYLGLGGDAASSAGLMWARPGSTRQAQFDYSFPSDTMQLRVNDIDAFQWFQGSSPGAYFRPVITGPNAPTLGDIAHPWLNSHVTTRTYMTGVFDSYGTGLPNGNVIAAVGSTYRRAVNGAATGTFFVKESGSGATGWIGK